jgi:hypothetical protein
MKSNIDLLLERYWECETSVAEESELKAYFASGEVDPKHVEFAPLFGYFVAQSQIQYSGPDRVSTPTKVVNMNRWLTSAAAIFLLCFAVLFTLKDSSTLSISDKPMVTNTDKEIEDPEEALRITKQALALVSQKLNKSKKTLTQNMAILDKVAILK